jgi:hypothetical protein
MFASLVALDYMFSITDLLENLIYGTVNTIQSNPISDHAHDMYAAVRNIWYSAVTGVLVPFLLFLSFTSSFINKNQNMVMYLIQALAVLMVTPIALFVFADIFTQMLSVSFLDSAYMATVYFNNFIYILVINMLMALASFIFVRNTVQEFG